MDALGVGRCVLVGHSDGATIAVINAGAVVDHRVRGVVAMAPHFFTEEMGLSEIAKTREAFEKGDLRARLAKYHSDPDNTFRGWNDAWLDPAFRDWDVTEVIDYIRVPVLAVQGRDDPYGTLAQISELESRSFAPVDTLILDHCGHAPHVDQRDAVLGAIKEFCARLEQIEQAVAPGL
jgi:pimeloyl-ACP methyl ester carboxylesterase